MGEMKHWETCYGCLDVERRTPHSTNCDRAPKPTPAEVPAAKCDRCSRFGDRWQAAVDECYALRQRITELEAALAAAAKEINCAGPVDHRIRVLKKEYSDSLEQAQQALQRVTDEAADTMTYETERRMTVEAALQQARGAMEAQDGRERAAGVLAGVSWEEHGCDWPDAVAETVVYLRAALQQAKKERDVRMSMADTFKNERDFFIRRAEAAQKALAEAQEQIGAYEGGPDWKRLYREAEGQVRELRAALAEFRLRCSGWTVYSAPGMGDVPRVPTGQDDTLTAAQKRADALLARHPEPKAPEPGVD